MRALIGSLLFLTLGISLASDQAASPYLSIDLGKLHRGDLIFRTANTPGSWMVLSQGLGWSHVGMLTQRDGQWVVIHACPPDNPGEPSGVRFESLLEFANHASSIGVYQMRSKSDRLKAEVAIKDAARYLGRPFDSMLNDKDRSAMYCTELIIDAWGDSGINLSGISRQEIDVPFLGSRVISLPDQLADWKGLERVDGTHHLPTNRQP